MIDLSNMQCTGCGACYQACPENCIIMMENEDGFLYPSIDVKKCKKCNLCSIVCPINDERKGNEIKEVYAAQCNAIDKCVEATSGGVFGALAEYVIMNNGVVYGCSMDEELRVKHVRITLSEKLIKIKGSKYVQSSTEDTFVITKKDLDNNILVLYTGTPCQIAGLKKFLKKDYTNLITVDLICHGVPSQAYFNKYVKYLEKNLLCKIDEINFRDKKNKGWSLAGSIRGCDSNGKISKKMYYFDSYFYYYFLEGSIYRNSCYTCKYAEINREGDFTLGDFWGIEKRKVSFNVKNGCSLVLINTYKAKKIWDKIDIVFDKMSMEEAMEYNEQLSKPMIMPKERKKRLEEYRQLPAEEIDKIFKWKYRRHRMISRLKYAIPYCLKSIFIKFKY